MLTLNDNCSIIMKMLRTWRVIVKIGKSLFSLNSAIALQSFLSRVTHLSPSVPRAGGAQIEARAGGV